jgi:hypothetical protein
MLALFVVQFTEKTARTVDCQPFDQPGQPFY